MSIIQNPLVMLIEECIHLRDTAQSNLSVVAGSEPLSRLERLVLISSTEAENPLTFSQIGRNLGHSRQVVQRAGNRLVDIGYLEKLPNPDHKTAALIQPTALGREFERQLAAVFDDVVGTLLSDSDLKTCRKMASDLKKLRAKIETYEPRD